MFTVTSLFVGPILTRSYEPSPRSPLPYGHLLDSPLSCVVAVLLTPSTVARVPSGSLCICLLFLLAFSPRHLSVSYHNSSPFRGESLRLQGQFVLGQNRRRDG